MKQKICLYNKQGYFSEIDRNVWQKRYFPFVEVKLSESEILEFRGSQKREKKRGDGEERSVKLIDCLTLIGKILLAVGKCILSCV